MYRVIITIFIIFLNLNANELILYTATNIDTNRSCQFYEEKNYLTENSKFIGACRDNFINGNATIQHHNGHSYSGSFKNGYYHGYGKFIWDLDNYIEGKFVKNYLTGLGKSYNYGNVSEGEFYKNLFTGYGTFSMKSGGIIIVKRGKKELLQSAIYEERAFWSKSSQADSLEFLKKSLSIREKYLKNHPLLIDTYDNLTQVLLRTKDRKSLEEAKKYSLKALKIRETIYNKNSETISTAYNNLALILSDLGKFSEALEFILKAIAIDETQLSANDPALASLYSNVALIYREMSQLIEAKKYILMSLNIRENIPNSKSNSEDLAIDYNTLSLIYQELGDLREAKEYAKQSLEIIKVLFGEHHIYSLKGYTNLAMIHLDLKEYKEAQKIIEKILALAEKKFAKDSYALSVFYNNSALMYKKIDKLDKAKEYALRGLKISEKVLSKHHPELGTTYANIALLYMKLNLVKEAKEYAEKALKIREINQNPIALTISYRDMSFIFIELKDYDKALFYAIKSFKLFLESRKFLSQLSNRAKKNSLDRDSIHIFNLFDMSLLVKREDVASKIMDLWLQYKGEISNSQSYLMALKSRTDKKEIHQKIDRLIDVKEDYTNLFIEKIYNLSSKEYDESITKLEKEKGLLEEYLSDKLQEYKESLQRENINSSQISRRLKESELYIDFAKTDRGYYIFTLDSNNSVNYRLLDKNATEIDKMVESYRKNIISFGNISLDTDIPVIEKKKRLSEIEEETKNLGHSLYKYLFDGSIKDYKKIIISPDGQLNLLPFEALYTDKGNYLIEEQNITYISSGKALLKAYRLLQESPSRNIVIFSNPSFDKNIVSEKNTTSKLTKYKGGELKAITDLFGWFYDLNNSEDAIFIANIFKDREDIKILPFTEENATKANLFKVKSPQILHFSTHSLYAKDKNRTINEPLLKSALALTGYNNGTDGDFRGIVTALEFSNLNLYNTELVFFSSCQSALGDIYSSEGVYGLNRASKLAGSKRVIATIWSVSDKESAMLVKKFYTNLERGRGYVESLTESKLEMIDSGYHPFFWAGFIENGID